MDQSELVRAVEGLSDSIEELSEHAATQDAVLAQLKSQRQGLHSTRIVLGCAVIGLMLDLGLTIAFGMLFQQVDANTHQVQNVQARTSTEILCPLYQVFALGIKLNPPPAGYTPDQLQLRQNAGDTIIAGLNKLGCS